MSSGSSTRRAARVGTCAQLTTPALAGPRAEESGGGCRRCPVAHPAPPSSGFTCVLAVFDNSASGQKLNGGRVVLPTASPKADQIPGDWPRPIRGSVQKAYPRPAHSSRHTDRTAMSGDGVDDETTRATIAAIKRLDAAFDRGDIDAFMAAMTDDCVWESFTPAPDGHARGPGGGAAGDGGLPRLVPGLRRRGDARLWRSRDGALDLPLRRRTCPRSRRRASPQREGHRDPLLCEGLRATCRHSWSSPPIRSSRRTSWISIVVHWGWVVGERWPRVRRGR